MATDSAWAKGGQVEVVLSSPDQLEGGVACGGGGVRVGAFLKVDCLGRCG